MDDELIVLMFIMDECLSTFSNHLFYTTLIIMIIKIKFYKFYFKINTPININTFNTFNIINFFFIFYFFYI